MKKTLVKLLALFGMVLLAASMAACDNGSSDDGDSAGLAYTSTGAGSTATGGTVYSGSMTVDSTAYTTLTMQGDSSSGTAVLSGSGASISGSYARAVAASAATTAYSGSYTITFRFGTITVTFSGSIVTLVSGSVTASGSGTLAVQASGGTGGTSSKTVTTVFVKMDAGTFSMGCSADYDETVHSVTLTRDFWICDHEVTQAEYKAVMGTNPSSCTGDESRPVEQVNWYDALVYCNRLSQQEGRTPCYTISGSTDPADWGAVPTSDNATWIGVACDFDTNGYRLPTEAEWEYAARAGDTTTGTRTWSGTSSESSLGSYAWYSANRGGSTTHPVKDKQPNAKGLYDMSGNVHEWCWDGWTGSGGYGSDAVTDPTGWTCSSRVVRGGSCWDYANNCAVSTRLNSVPGARDYSFGFRVCRSAQ